MSIELWLAYVIAVLVISGTPGPNMLLSMTHGIHHGLTRTFSTMLGLLIGMTIILSISLAGLGAVLLRSSYIFEIIKYAGAAYLIYLGIKAWRTANEGISAEGRPHARGILTRCRIGILVSLSNPKAILFG